MNDRLLNIARRTEAQLVKSTGASLVTLELLADLVAYIHEKERESVLASPDGEASQVPNVR